jgi:D-serine deaminase-like pyridoxal phosphate-dependent protein
MQQTPPARIGMAENEIDTPALLIDLDSFEANLDSMADAVAHAGVKLRAHAKTHKSPVIAHMQMARGAVGQCVQKVGEAEILAWGGVSDILVSNEVVGADKLARLAALARITRIAVCVDDAGQIGALGDAAEAAGVLLRVLVEIDVGANRCGVTPGSAAVALAQQIEAHPHLRFGGLQAYHGSAQHLRTHAERHAAIASASDHTRCRHRHLRVGSGIGGFH